MTFREPTHLPAGVRKAVHCLSLLLLPALRSDALSHPFHSPPAPGLTSDWIVLDSIPYLVVATAPPLRFRPPPPQPVRPAIVPPPPHHDETPPLLAAAPVPAGHATPSAAADTPPAPASPSTAPVAAPALEPNPVAPAAAPAPILRDELSPVFHPEDVLPFFNIPHAAPEVNPASTPAEPPTPAGSLPPSSARYTQQ